ncbi:hypothetical protein ANCDUO_15148, partial [Ancylostoma duodenale]
MELYVPDPLIAIRQKRQKLLKPNKALNAAEVNRRASGYSVDSGSADKRLFGVSLVTCMQNERRLDLESRCRSLDDSACATKSLPPGFRLFSTTACEVGEIRAGDRGVKRSKVAVPLHSGNLPRIVLVDANARLLRICHFQNLYPDSNPSSPSPYTGSAPPTCSLPVKDFSLITHPPEPEKEVVT